MERPIIAVIEGADFASALSDYLAQFHGFARIEYDGREELNTFLSKSVISSVWTSPRLLLLRWHLTALVNGKATVGEFRQVDQTLANLGAKLVLAVGKKDSTGMLADGYAHSQLDKRVHPKSAPVTHLLHWLGIRGAECNSATCIVMTRSRSTTASEPRSRQRATRKS